MLHFIDICSWGGQCVVSTTGTRVGDVISVIFSVKCLNLLKTLSCLWKHLKEGLRFIIFF